MRRPENHIIQQIPTSDRRRFLSLCEPVDLRLSAVLCDAGDAARHAYFPVDGFVSLVATLGGHPDLEVGMIGREGMVGSTLSLDVPSAPLRALVQGEGTAWRIGADDFRDQLQRSGRLQRVVSRYVYVQIVQLASAASCLHYHLVAPRLARWLLMSQDRAHTDHFHVTHEFLAYMLGVRRVGVTTAAGALQRAGFIAYRRGEMTVVDRPGLESVACSCYASDRASYARLMRLPRRPAR